jgi:hypothetical protein
MPVLEEVLLSTKKLKVGSSGWLVATKFDYWFKVDENLFYKGVDKSHIEPSRLAPALPSHGLPIEAPEAQQGVASTSASDSDPPPYLFESGASLLQLTEEHNVRADHRLAAQYLTKDR